MHSKRHCVCPYVNLGRFSTMCGIGEQLTDMSRFGDGMIAVIWNSTEQIWTHEAGSDAKQYMRSVEILLEHDEGGTSSSYWE